MTSAAPLPGPFGPSPSGREGRGRLLEPMLATLAASGLVVFLGGSLLASYQAPWKGTLYTLPGKVLASSLRSPALEQAVGTQPDPGSGVAAALPPLTAARHDALPVELLLELLDESDPVGSGRDVFGAGSADAEIVVVDVPGHVIRTPVAEPERQPESLAGDSSRQVLAERLAAGQAWLEQADLGHFSTQLMVVGEESIDDYSRFVSDLGAGVMVEHLYFFRLSGQRLLIFFGDFDSPDMAQSALAGLDERIRRSGPYVLPVRSVRAKVARMSGAMEG